MEWEKAEKLKINSVDVTWKYGEEPKNPIIGKKEKTAIEECENDWIGFFSPFLMKSVSIDVLLPWMKLMLMRN